MFLLKSKNSPSFKSSGLDKLFESITNIKVNTTDAPEESAVRGLVKIVSDSKFKKLPYEYLLLTMGD